MADIQQNPVSTSTNPATPAPKQYGRVSTSNSSGGYRGGQGSYSGGQNSDRRGGPAAPGGSVNSRDQRRNALRSKRTDNSRRRGSKNNKRKEEEQELESRVIEVRRVTRVVKGGKRMRFSALVVVGDREGKVGIGLKKGLDYQDSVNKATRKAKTSLLSINIDDQGSIAYPSITTHKSCVVYLKPAKSGTGVIAGGFLRPVLELAGVRNVYSKIIRSRNKIPGTQAAFQALTKYSSVTK